MNYKLQIADLKAVKDYFDENASEASQQIITLIQSLEESEVEVNLDNLKEEIMKLVEPEVQAEVAEQVADAISKIEAKKETKPTMDKKQIRNEFASTIMTARNRDEALKLAKDFVVKNGITFTSGDFTNPIVDYNIVNKWEDNNELWNALNFTPVSKWFYTTQEWDDTYAKASLWTKGSTTEKDIQALTLNPIEISTAYVYKRQRYAQEDLDDIQEQGNLGQFIDWTTTELRQHVIDMILAAILGEKSLSNFQSITTGQTTFTTVIAKAETVADSFDYVTIENARELADSVIGRGSRWLVMNKHDLTRLAAHKHATGGTTEYWTKAEVAEQLGVDNIYVTDLASEGRIVCFIPSEYWVKVKNTLDLAYPQYEINAQNLQYEINCGGKIHGLLSTAILKKAE